MKIEFKPLNNIVRNVPPEPMKFNLPNWYKDLSNTMSGRPKNARELKAENSHTISTAKKCVPLTDFLTSGYLLKFSTDIFIDPMVPLEGDEVSFICKTKYDNQTVTFHPYEQLETPIDGKKHTYIKFRNFWVIKTPPGYSCLFMQPLRLGSGNFVMLPGIVDTDKYDDCINFPGYLTVTKDFKINCGDPMMMVFPFKRDAWEMEISKSNFNANESNVFLTIHRYFDNVYRNFFHEKKRYD